VAPQGLATPVAVGTTNITAMMPATTITSPRVRRSSLLQQARTVTRPPRSSLLR
jgi:hypothetical protein